MRSDLLPDRTRIKSFSANITEEEFDYTTDSEIDNYLTGHFPALDSVVLRQEVDVILARSESKAVLDAPRLRTLHLYNRLWVDWTAAFFSNLTSLSMVFTGLPPRINEHGDFYTPPQVLHLLKKCTRLVGSQARQPHRWLRSGSRRRTWDRRIASLDKAQPRR